MKPIPYSDNLLVRMARQQAWHRGCAELRVATQGANQPAWRSYEQCGFELLRTEHHFYLVAVMGVGGPPGGA